MSKIKEEIYKQKIKALKRELNETKQLLENAEAKNEFFEKSNLEFNDLTKALSASKEKFLAYNQNSPISIIQIDPRGVIIHSNKATEEITGFTTDELKGKNIFELLSPANTLFELREIIGFEINDKKSYETKILNKSGEEVYVQIDAVKISTGESVAFCKNITEKKISERQNLLFKTLYENAPDGIFLTDKKGRIINCNIEFTKQTGFNKNEIIGKNYSEFYSEKFNPLTSLKKIISPFSKETEINQKRADKTSLPVWRKIISFDDPQSDFSGNLAITRDISSLKNSTENLYKTAKEVELRNEKINIANQELTLLNTKLEKINKALTQSLEENKKITRHLEESQQLYKLITENSGDFITTISFKANPEILYSSPSHQKLGYKPGELQGKKVFDYIHPEDIAQLRKTLEIYLLDKTLTPEKLQENKQEINISFRFKDKFNNWLNMESIASFLTESILITSRDVTLRIQNERIISKQNDEIKLANERYKLLNKQLKQSEEEYRNIYNSTAEGIFIHDIDSGRIIDVNKAVEIMYGYTRDEILNLKTNSLSINEAPYDSAASLERIKQAADGKILTFDWPAKTKDNKPFWTSVTLKKAVIADKERILAVVRNIDEIKQAQDKLKNSEEIFKQLSELSPTGIFIYQDNYFVYTNQSCTNILGYTKDEFLKMKFWEAVHPDMRKTVKELGKKRQIGEKLIPRYEMKLISKNGETKWVDFNGTNIVFQNKPAAIGNIIDISEIKNNIRELKIAKEKAEEADKLKSTFLANMSHEIRTPMNGILGFAQLLENADTEHEKRKEYVKIINKSGEQLLTIIDDILDISKIESGQIKITKEKTGLNELLSEIYAIYKNKYPDKPGNTKIIKGKHAENTEIFINTDEYRLKQIMSNLINNAVKFTEKGFVEFGYEVFDEIVRFYVKDTGIGIPEDKYSVIFSRFGQIEPEYTKAKGGTGIGLTIAKALTELLGGEIYFESSVNVGITFYFTLPNR